LSPLALSPGQVPSILTGFTPPMKHVGEAWIEDATTITASGIYELTPKVAFTTTTPTICNVNPWDPTRLSQNGLVTAFSPGLCIIRATLNSFAAEAHIQIAPARILSIRLSAASPVLYRNGNRQLHVLATYDDGATAEVTYASTFKSNAPSTVDFYGLVPTLPGMASAAATGQAVVTATAPGGAQGTVALTVSSTSITGIDIAPGNATLANQSKLQLTATARLDDGTSADITSDVVWIDAAPALLVSNSFLPSGIGANGVATGERAGSYPVSAVVGFGESACSRSAIACNSASTTLMVE
jgi:hypothetical protein